MVGRDRNAVVGPGRGHLFLPVQTQRRIHGHFLLKRQPDESRVIYNLVLALRNIKVAIFSRVKVQLAQKGRGDQRRDQRERKLSDVWGPYHVGPVVDEDPGGSVGAQLQGPLDQRDVLHPPARLDAKRGRDDHLGLRNACLRQAESGEAQRKLRGGGLTLA